MCRKLGFESAWWSRTLRFKMFLQAPGGALKKLYTTRLPDQTLAAISNGSDAESARFATAVNHTAKPAMLRMLQAFEGLKGLDFQPTFEKIGFPKCFTSAFQFNAMTNARDRFDDASEFRRALVDAEMEECEWAMQQCGSGDEGEVGTDEVYLEE